jgi:uncharacterized SAM-binding protein YcdF (DUF218 family)
MKVRKRGLLVPTAISLVIFAAALYIFHGRVLAALGGYLVEDDPPEKADAVVALAGDDDGYRVLKAGQLVREGWAPYALISGTPFLLSNHAEMTIDYAVAKGYPRSYFRPFERNAVATRDETADIADELKRLGIHKILLVSSNYHTRRAGLLMRKAAPFLEVRVVAAPDKYFTPGSWWKTRAGQRTFALEWAKTISARLGN